MTFRKSTTIRQFALSTPSMKDNWDIQKAKLKKKYPSLTDSDLRYDEGKKGAMWEKLQLKLGLSKEELRKIIASV
ncbi:MAG: hypothetical protein WC879_17395 [Melioribacteraceae bacterium]